MRESKWRRFYPLAVFAFTGTNSEQGKSAKEEGSLFRAQGRAHYLDVSALIAAQHRFANWLPALTQTEPEHRNLYFEFP